jgi:glycosyltransferase involved in cell wall biosynthesis
MNVLMVVPWDNRGGVCGVVGQVAQHLQSRQHAVAYLLPGSRVWPVRDTTRDGFPAFRMNVRPTATLGAPLRSRIAFWLTLPWTLVALLVLMRSNRIDVVNIHFPGTSSMAFAILRRLGVIRLVTSIHGADLLPHGQRLPPPTTGVGAVLAASDLIVAPSAAYLTAAAEAWPEIRTRPSRAIHNGVDPGELGYDAGAGDTTVSPPYVLSVLQLVQYKGVDVLLRAFSALSGDYPEHRLVLISGGPDRAVLEELAGSLGIANRVDFLGFLEKAVVADYLRGCTVFVLPSRSNSESFGIAAAEAMALDRPVVASRIGGLVELIEDGVTGVLTPPSDVGALEAAIRRLLDDARLRQTLGRAAGERVRRDFLWSRTGSQYENALSHAGRGDIASNEGALVSGEISGRTAT